MNRKQKNEFSTLTWSSLCSFWSPRSHLKQSRQQTSNGPSWSADPAWSGLIRLILILITWWLKHPIHWSTDPFPEHVLNRRLFEINTFSWVQCLEILECRRPTWKGSSALYPIETRHCHRFPSEGSWAKRAVGFFGFFVSQWWALQPNEKCIGIWPSATI